MSSRHRWNTEHHQFIIDNVEGITNKDLTKKFNAYFNTTVTKNAIVGQKVILGLGNGSFHKFTEEQKKFISDNSNGTTSVEMAKVFNQRFGTNLTIEQIQNFRGRNKLKCGVYETRFKKGKIPNETSFKKGKKPNETSFKKGCISLRTRPVGSERINSMGLVEVKETDLCKNSKKNWRLKHHVIWEHHNGQCVPKNHVVIFANGDKTDLDIANLLLVPKNEYFTMINNGLIFENTDLTKTGSLIAKLQVKLKNKVEAD